MNRLDFIKKTGLGATGIGFSGLIIPSVFANVPLVKNIAELNSRVIFLSKLISEIPNCEK